MTGGVRGSDGGADCGGRALEGRTDFNRSDSTAVRSTDGTQHNSPSSPLEGIISTRHVWLSGAATGSLRGARFEVTLAMAEKSVTLGLLKALGSPQCTDVMHRLGNPLGCAGTAQPELPVNTFPRRGRVGSSDPSSVALGAGPTEVPTTSTGQERGEPPANLRSVSRCLRVAKESPPRAPLTL